MEVDYHIAFNYTLAFKSTKLLIRAHYKSFYSGLNVIVKHFVNTHLSAPPPTRLLNPTTGHFSMQRD